MKTASLIILTVVAIGCSGAKQKSKYDFSNVQSTSLDANHTSSNVRIMKDTTIVIPVDTKN